MSKNDKDTYWNAFNNTVWKLDQSIPELYDVATCLHLGEGALVGLATFAAMKRGNVAPRLWAKLAPKSIRPASASSRAATALGTTATVGVNVGAGLATATMTHMYLTTTADRQSLAHRIAYAPLMPGYSPCADLFCHDDLFCRDDESYQSLHTALSTTTITYPDAKMSVTINGVDVPPNKVSEILDRIKNVDEPLEEEDLGLFLLSMILLFQKNCKLRRELEQKIRTDKGIAPHEPVEIPFMGVPTNEQLPQSVLATKAKYLLNVADGYRDRSFNQEETALAFEWVKNELFLSVVAGIVTFVCLRRVPQRLMTRIHPYLNRFLKQEYVLVSSEKTNSNIVIRASKFGFDSFVSIAVMCSLFFQDYYYDRLPRYLVETPLVSGRSTISEHLCEDLVKEYGEMLSTFQKSDHQSLRHLGAMVHNCRLRQEEERQLRLKQGLPDDVPVKIPAPGVSRGITRDEIDKAWAESLANDRK